MANERGTPYRGSGQPRAMPDREKPVNPAENAEDEELRLVFRDAGYNVSTDAGRALLTDVMAWARGRHESAGKRLAARTKLFLWVWGAAGGVLLLIVNSLVQRWLKL